MEVTLIADLAIINHRKIEKEFTPTLESTGSVRYKCVFSISIENSKWKQYSTMKK